MFVRVLKKSDIQANEIRCVSVHEKSIVICCTESGELFALDNRCSHAGLPLADGKLQGNEIVCPAHGASFDLASGQALTRPAFKCVATYPLREVDGDIEVDV